MTTSVVGLRKTIIYAKISPKMVNPRDIAGNAEEEEEDEEEEDEEKRRKKKRKKKKKKKKKKKTKTKKKKKKKKKKIAATLRWKLQTNLLYTQLLQSQYAPKRRTSPSADSIAPDV